MVAHEIISSSHQGMTPLYMACMDGNLDTVKLLLERQASPRVQDYESDFDPLSASCYFGHAKTVSVLLDSSLVDPLNLDSIQRNCLHIALGLFQRQIVSLIISTLSSRTTVLDQLLDQRDLFGRTPFDYVISNFPQSDSKLSKGISDLLGQHRHIYDTVSDLKKDYEIPDRRFDSLGKQFVFAGDDEDAIFAYQRQITWFQDKGKRIPIHDLVACDSCGTDSGMQSSRYVCRICVDIDLCDKCHENFTRGIYSGRTCRMHKFLCVLLPAMSEEEQGAATSVNKDQVDTWLADLEERYTIGMFSCAGTDLFEDAREAEVDLKILALSPRLACWNFRTSLLGFSLPPSPASIQGLRLYREANNADHIPSHTFEEVD